MSSNSSNSSKEGGEGNTIPPPNKKQSPACKKWTFTLHNYSVSHISSLIDFFDSSNSSYIFSEEKGKSGETPHIQGYCELGVKMRMTALKAALGETFNTIHLEKAKGNKEQNIAYITKEGGAIYKSKDFIIMRPKKKLACEGNLFKWQEFLCATVETEPNDRDIYWFYGDKGGEGKTTFCKYLHRTYGAICLSGKAADMKHAIVEYKKTHNDRCPEIIVVNLPRSFNNDYLSYPGLEDVKDMFFHSGKYEGGMVDDNSPHLIIFSNELPDVNKLTKERWQIYTIEDKGEFQKQKYYSGVMKDT